MEEYLSRLQATMESLSDVRPTFKGMLYGVSGVGKTVHSLMIAQDITPPDKEILYIDTAEGWVSLENHKELKARTQRMHYINLSQIEALCKAVRTGAEPFDRFGTIILDEASSAADSALDEVLKYRASQDRGKDPDTPTQPDYNTTTNRVRKSYMELLTLQGIHVILVSHARKDKDNRNLEVTSPSFLPKLGQKIKQPLHLIANLSGNEIDSKYVRIMQVHPTRTIDAKCRIGGLEPQVEYPIFIERLQGWLAGTVPSTSTNNIVTDRDPELAVVTINEG
jgi:ATP-dependent Clp protease ATP-binding subunit ClpA